MGRFGCNVLVNQDKKMIYIVGGHDEAKSELPDHIICFHDLQWKINSTRYVLEGKCLSKAKRNHSKRLYCPKVAIKNSSCILLNDLNMF